MDKNEKQAMKQAFKEAEKAKFLESIPCTIEQLEDLFDHLDNKLSDADCTHSLIWTNEFLSKEGINMDAFKKWAADNGGFCDCEVLANIEEKLE